MKDYLDNLPSPRLDEKFQSSSKSLQDKQAHLEANRCLYCFDAPCIKACATGINIPEFIRKIGSGNIKGSAKTILESNILGYSCSKVCPVEVMCEGACVYHHSNETPVHIALLQEFAVKKALENKWHFFKKGNPLGKKIAVIGSGPSGLACAHELTHFGYEITVFEGRDHPGGLNTVGIAPYKLSAKASLKEVRYIQEIGFEIKRGVWIGKDKPFSELESEFDAIFIGAGLGLDQKMSILGEELEGYYGGLSTIEKIRTEGGFSVEKMNQVVVVGGGNTSLDLVRQLKQLGVPTVTLLYRRGEEQIKAYQHEVEKAKKEGVLFKLLSQPIQILGKHGKVTSIKCIQMKLGEPDKSGRKQVSPIEDSEFHIPTDHVFVAIGQPSWQEFLESLPQVELNHNGTIRVNSKTYQTTNPKIFAGGDCINGGKEVVNSVQHGRDSARSIHQILSNQSS